MMMTPAVQLLRAGAVALSLVGAAGAQAPAGRRLEVDVRITSISFGGDTLTLAYEIQNGAGSPFSLGYFALQTPVRVERMESPVDDRRWRTGLLYGDEPMPRWGAMRRPLAPGQAAGPLTIRAVGVTDLVGYLAVPYLAEVLDSIETDEPEDVLRSVSTPGITVSIIPIPDGTTRLSQLARLQGFLTRSCGADNWITQRGVCQSLRGKLDRAQAALAAGDLAGARPHLQSLASELDAQYGEQPGKHVTPIAYALLRPNVNWLLRQ
jgi:hypothetical protein